MNAEIRHLGDPARHFWLTRSVARTMGVNLSEAMASGLLSAPGYAQMVNSCRKCRNTALCEAWLSVGRDAPAAAPDHCPNAVVLTRLAHKEQG